MRLAHTADIHWRGLSRHDEYRLVFEAFIEDCRNNKVDHIFVGGDLFHTKTSGISPEYIEQMTWWLSSMSKVAPVHIILGNHDGNLTNLSRQDAVSPIVDAMKNNRVKLYKKSGVYEFSPGYNWCVFSPFDEEGWNNVEPVSGMVNIACFHGPIAGSVTEVGWNIEDSRSVSFFEGFDFALLGDIHKRQMLGYRNGKPWIAYPGTPIQQNYAEDLEHGYLLWDISSVEEWDVQFRKLPNPRPFVTLSWNGSVDILEEEAKKHPRGTRFRIRNSDHISHKDIKNISDLLTGKLGASEITHKSDVQVDRSIIKSGTTTLAKEDLRSHDVLLKLVKEHHKTLTISDKVWTDVGESIKTILSSVTSSEETSRNSKWSIRYVEFDNMFTYGEGNSVNFDSLNGIVGIFGSNRLGKSSIVGTIMYSLFNTTDRGPMKNIHVCNIRKPYCSSRIVVSHNGIDYIVERQTTKTENKKGIVSASTSLNLYRIRDDGEADELNGEQRNDTEKTIRSLIGTSEDFLLTSLSAQGETNQFIMQGSSKRRAILTRFLDLDVFDKMYDIVNKDANGIKYQLKSYPEKNWTELVDQYHGELKAIEEQNSKIEDELQHSNSELSHLKSEMLKHGTASVVTEDQVESQRKKVKSLETASKECSDKILLLTEELASLGAKIKKIQDVRDSNNIESLKKVKENYKSLESSLVDMRHVYEKEETSLKQHQKSLKILDDVPCGDEYPTCKFIKDAHASKQKIEGQRTVVSTVKSRLDTALASLEAIKAEGSLDRLEKLEKLFELESKLELEVSRKEIDLERQRSSCDSRAVELASAEDRLRTLEMALNNDENAEVVTIRTNLEKLSKAIKELDARRFENATKKGRIIASLDKIVEEKAARDKLLEDLKIRELISSAFSKKGIPMSITKSQLPAINAEIAKILQGIVEFSVEIENDDETDSAEIYINYGDSRRVIELCSGMEKTIASLAVRVAMLNVSTLPRSDIFIIDEGFGTLDAVAVEACNRLLVSLKRYFKTIVVITHVDGIKDVVDHVLEITKNEKDAKIVYGGD